MTMQRRLLWVVITVLLAGVVLPAHAAPAPKEPAPKVGPKAGAITALLPIATITRGTGKAAITAEAKKGDELVWNDLLKTQKGGRARITLTDQSILSLGSQAELKIVKHDDRSQQTALQLYGGRVRAEVAKITRQGGSFELRTPTAVAGVIGTDFGSDASTVGTTVFLCISGVTQVSSSDANIQGSVQCAAGLTTSVTAGKPPTIPTNATPQQIQQLIQDTEPAIISAMTPTSVTPGTTVDAAINGTKLGAVDSVSVTGSGVTVSLAGAPTDTSVTVHMVIAANATPGPHTITLSKPNGAASAAVFTVLQAPTAAQSGDLKKPYHDQFDQERQTNKAGLTALIASVQQAVDQTLQQLQTANQGNVVDLSPAANTLNAQVTAIQNVINQAGGQVDQAVTSALATFDSQYQLAWNALLQRDPAGVPDDTFNQAVQAAYNQVNASLGLAFANISTGLNTNVQAATGAVTQLQQTWLTTIAAAAIVSPTPAANNTEFSAFLGAAFGGGTIAAPDASRSRGNSGASIVRYQWVLCDSSYKPAQFGVPIAANATGCNALPGYASTNADFSFPTCNLTPADYIARVTVTDTNNQQAAMDVKIHVLSATYDDPATRVLNLAAAYSTLQVTQFLAFFDETSFSGYSSLAENVRNTFPLLSSMNINPRISQTSKNCNDATVRADWVQNYTYKSNPNLAFSQSEQLSMRMTRNPGRGWYITDFQGDNGTVQGQLPGPATTTNPQPDMQVSAVYATFVGHTTTAPQIVPPGAQSFTAVVTNVGGADLTAATMVRFSLLDISSATLTSVNVPLTVPLAAGATQNVAATLNVPTTLANGTAFQVQATVNPGCTVPEATCDGFNTSSQPLTLSTGQANYVIQSVSFVGHTPPFTGAQGVRVGETLIINAVVANVGNASPTGQITVIASCSGGPPGNTSCRGGGGGGGGGVGGGGNPTTTIAAPAAGTTITATMTATLNGFVPGTYSGLVALTTSIPQSSTADDSISVPFEVVVPDLQVVSVTPSRALSASTPWLSGEGLDFTVVVRNGGNTASAGNEILTMNLNGFQVDPGGRGAAVKVPSLAANASTSILVHAIAPDVGTGTLSSGTLVTKVAADTAGDLNFANNSLAQGVAVSNWRLLVSGAGSQDAPGNSSGPLVITITSGGTSWSNQALVTGTVDSGGTTALTFVPTPGVVGSKLAITNFAAATGPSSFLVTVLTSDSTTQSGLYPAQVIVQLMDGGAVTAQRQATIHVSVQNFVTSAPNYPLLVQCTHNGASCVGGAATAIQVNGALTEQYIATVMPVVGVPGACSPNPTTGTTCQGTADIVITDGTNTLTTPPQAKGQPFNSGAVFQVTANQDANGNIATGAAGGYSITINGIQRSGQTSPDTVGQTVGVPVNVGDVVITSNAGANSCTGVPPGGPPVQLTVSWDIANMGGFNVPSITWEWENANHVPVGAAPLSFTSPSGTSSGAPNYSNPPIFNLTNSPAANIPPPDGVLLYFFAATVSNGASSATKYFPFYFDASLSQSFCGAAGAARGGFTRINGSWSRSAAGGGGGPATLGARLAQKAAAGGSVDLKLSAADVSYTPSMPKTGDTVQVRFRVRNEGTADATGVPIALQVNGVTVTADMFDVGAGRTTLGGLQWNSASVPEAVSTRPAAVSPAGNNRRGRLAPPSDSLDTVEPAGLTRPSALLVIDPQHTIQQKTTLDKSAPLAHFSLRYGDGAASGVATGPSQRVLLEIQEGACAGMRLATGSVGPCGTADLELTIADIAKGIYMLNSDFGVADLGASFGGPAQGTARASSELAGVAGHSYAVQLSGGRTAVITIDSIRNPRQLDAAARAIFRNSAIQVMRGLGSNSGPAAPGELAGGMRGGATVFLQLTIKAQ